MVAPAQFRGRFTGNLGVSARHPRLLPRLARALRHALDDDGGACRRCSSCAGTEWRCSRVKARLATSGLRSWPMQPSNSCHRRDQKFATVGWNALCRRRTGGTGCQIRCACLSSNRAKADDQSRWTCMRTRSGHAAEPSKSTMKLQTDFLPSIAATTSSTLPSDMGAISSIACGRAAYRNCHPERHVSILDVASAPIWLVSLIKVLRSPASNRVPRCADWRGKKLPPDLFSPPPLLRCVRPVALINAFSRLLVFYFVTHYVYAIVHSRHFC